MIELVKFYDNRYPRLYEKYMQKENDSDYVYVMGNPSTGLCKIGITEYPKRRQKSIQSALGCDIFIIVMAQFATEIDVSARLVKRLLHEYYKDKRIIGEWFRLSKRDIFIINDFFMETADWWAESSMPEKQGILNKNQYLGYFPFDITLKERIAEIIKIIFRKFKAILTRTDEFDLWILDMQK